MQQPRLQLPRGRATLRVACKVTRRQGAPAKPSQAGPGPLQIDLEKVYSDGSVLPARQVGPIRVASIPGKGRGLVALCTLQPGDLLLVCQPLGPLGRGPEGIEPRPDDLLAVLQREGVLSEGDRRRLALLSDGSPASQRQEVRLEELDPSSAATHTPPVALQAKGFGAKPSKPTASQPADSSSRELGADWLRQVVSLNAWGTATGELGVCGSRGEASHSFIGLWPEVGLLNHSCAPNTALMLVGDRLLLRAAANIPSGGELLTSYLDAQGRLPLSERRAVLQTCYGFTCACPRCKEEEDAPAEVQAALGSMWQQVARGGVEQQLGSLLTALSAALEAGEAAKASQAAEQLQQLVATLSCLTAGLEQAMEAAGLQQQARRWLRASAYTFYKGVAMAQDAIQEWRRKSGAGGLMHPDPSLPAELLALVTVFAPLSDSHLYLSLDWLAREGEASGKEAARTAEAARECLSSHIARYGRVNNARLTHIMTERGKVRHSLGVIDTPTPWAAAPAPTGSSSSHPVQLLAT
ncbi:hypothetical protein V8C86DRAFT_2769007 [Haematococcus lacustris]